MTSLVLASVFLLTTHFTSSTPLRPAFVGRWGEGAWLGLYSLVSFAAFGWWIHAWTEAPHVALFQAPAWARGLALAVMPLTTCLIVGSLTAPTPMSAGAMGLADRPDPVRGMGRITRHPMFWGIGLWGLVHMLVRPDVASWLLFGTMVVLSFVGGLLQDRKKYQADPERFEKVAAVTSFIPFVAILTGRQRWPAEPITVGQVVGGLAVFGILVVVHPLLIGVPVLPM